MKARLSTEVVAKTTALLVAIEEARQKARRRWLRVLGAVVLATLLCVGIGATAR